MGKHAWCVMAHADEYCLNSLLKSLDDKRNDIFLLIDRKSELATSGLKIPAKGRLFILPPEERVDIRWGGLSQVKAELILFSKALESGNYDYIHLMSGADLPLKSQDHIHNFFDALKRGTNLVCFAHGEAIERNLEFKTRYRHPFVEYQRFTGREGLAGKTIVAACKLIRHLSVNLQRMTGYRRSWKGLELKKGSQWVSITPDFARYLVDNRPFIMKRFKGVICPDEIFVQTMLYNSEYRDTIRDYEGKNYDEFRLIDWQRGNPYVWRTTDYDELMKSEAMFARKFSSSLDKKIIDMITNHTDDKNIS